MVRRYGVLVGQSLAAQTQRLEADRLVLQASKMTTVLSESRSAGNRFAALIENVLREREKIRSVRKTLGLDRADVAKGKTKSDAWRLIGPLRSKDCTARTRRSHGSGATLLRASAHSSACHQRSLHALPCTAQVIECHHEHRRRPQNVFNSLPSDRRS